MGQAQAFEALTSGYYRKHEFSGSSQGMVLYSCVAGLDCFLISMCNTGVIRGRDQDTQSHVLSQKRLRMAFPSRVSSCPEFCPVSIMIGIGRGRDNPEFFF